MSLPQTTTGARTVAARALAAIALLLPGATLLAGCTPQATEPGSPVESTATPEPSAPSSSAPTTSATPSDTDWRTAHDAPRGTFTPLHSLEVGDCVVTPGYEASSMSQLEVVPCAQAHDREVSAILEAPQDMEYPDEFGFYDLALPCISQRFEQYVGTHYEDSSWEVTWTTPDRAAWDRDGDRRLVCMISHRDAEWSTGSPSSGDVTLGFEGTQTPPPEEFTDTGEWVDPDSAHRTT